MGINNPKVSIIIVFFRGFSSLQNTLKSLKKQKSRYKFEVIIVDNGSTRGVKKAVKNILTNTRYIKSPKNLGYGGGNNLGIKFARGEYLFILNPDTILQAGCINSLSSFLDKNNKVAAVAPNTLDETGKVFSQMGSRLLTPLSGIFALSFLNKAFPNNPISRKYWVKDIPMNKLREVDALPGSAFMIRKSVFKKVRGYDEKMFLYFEESDLGKRIKEAGYKMFINPNAEVIHSWLGPKSNSIKLKKHFNKSRFYYFCKHYGVVNALLVELFTRISKQSLYLTLILFLSIFLRFYKIKSLMHFIGDFAWYYLQAKDMILNGGIPLVGVPSSVPILRQGAVWTWMLAGSLIIGKFHPVSGAFLSGALGVTAVVGTYYLTKLWFGKRVGLVAALIAATSPFIINMDRYPFITAGIYPLTIIISLFLTKSMKEGNYNWFFLGFFLALIYQFELAAFIMLPIVTATLILSKSKLNRKSFLIFLLGGAIGLSPFIIHDIREGIYLQTVGFLAWLVIKIYEGLSGIFTAGGSLLIFTPFLLFIKELILPASSGFAYTLFILSFALFLYKFTNIYKYKGVKTVYLRYLLVWSIFTASAFFLRGSFSEAYFPLLFFPFLVLIALFYDALIKKNRKLGWGLVLVLSIINSAFILRSFGKLALLSPLSKRVEVVNIIAIKSNGDPIKLTYLGPNDHFDSGDDHWEYLLWWKGVKLDNKAKLEMLIAESTPILPDKYGLSHDFGTIKIAEP